MPHAYVKSWSVLDMYRPYTLIPITAIQLCRLIAPPLRPWGAIRPLVDSVAPRVYLCSADMTFKIAAVSRCILEGTAHRSPCAGHSR